MPATDPSNKPMKKHRGRWWRWPLYALLVLAVAFGIFRYTVHHRVANRINVIRDAGYPVTLEELDAWYPTPDGLNAADVYQKAFDAYVGDKQFEETLPLIGDRVELPKPGEKMPEDVAARVAYYLEQNAEAIALLKEAAKIERCRYPVDMTEGIWPRLPHTTALRHSVRLMRLQVMTDLEHGAYDQAVKNCLTMLAIAQSLDQEPTVISALVGTSLRAGTYKQMLRVLLSGGASDEQLNTLRDALAQDTTHEQFRRVMVGERSSRLSLFLDPAETMKMDSGAGLALIRLWKFSGLFDLDQDYFLRHMKHFCDQAESRPWPLPTEPDDPPSYYKLSRLVTPFGGRSVVTSYHIDTHRQALMTAIEVERYRQTKGTLPESLQTLVPDYMESIPTDFFNGEPLKYRVESGGAVIYSVGEDGIDQGGRPYDHRREYNRDATDISVILGLSAEALWPIQKQEESTSYGYGAGYGGFGYGVPDDDEAYLEYIKELSVNGFPELVPRPKDGRWSTEEY